MHGPLYTELISYATALVVMQRLESRHSLLKTQLRWRHQTLPLTASAAMRRRQNKDLETPAFQKNLRHLLTSIGELYPGPWRSTTELIERVSQLSAEAFFDDLSEERVQLESFKQGLAAVASSASSQKQPVSDLEASLRREHIRKVLTKGKCYALCGCVHAGVWSVFRVLNINPAANMYMQRCVHLAEDVFWQGSSHKEASVGGGGGWGGGTGSFFWGWVGGVEARRRGLGGGRGAGGGGGLFHPGCILGRLGGLIQHMFLLCVKQLFE